MNSIEKVWKQFLQEVASDGNWVVKDDGDEICEIIDNHCFIPNVYEEVMGNTPFTMNTELFLKMVEQGKFNIDGYPMRNKELGMYLESLNDPNQIYLEEDDAFVYTYPERLQCISQANKMGEVVDMNQLEIIKDRLREHLGSNRAVATLYASGLDYNEQHIPCLNWCQALVRDDVLCLHIVFRSNDLFSAFPSNMLFVQYVGLKLVEELLDTYPRLKFGGVFYNSSSLHVYRGDWEQLERVLGI